MNKDPYPMHNRFWCCGTSFLATPVVHEEWCPLLNKQREQFQEKVTELYRDVPEQVKAAA